MMQRHELWRASFAVLMSAGELLALDGPARAAEDVAGEVEAEAAGDNAVSVKLAWLQLSSPPAEEEPADVEREVLRRAGVSLSYERSLIPGWLELEATVLFAPGEGGLTLPVDLLLKKPFELSEHVGLFVGLGLATEWFEAGERESAYGLGTQAGGQYWLTPQYGIVLEGEYNLLLQPETVHEVVLATGGALRF